MSDIFKVGNSIYNLSKQSLYSTSKRTVTFGTETITYAWSSNLKLNP